jgi:hypothetical protein
MPGFKDDIRVRDTLRARMRASGSPPVRRRGGAPPIPGKDDFLRVGSNVRLTLRDEPNGKIVEERESHNIFLDYGREWISELIGLDTGYLTFRNDRIRYMAFGIGGTEQLIPAATIRATWAGFPNDWDYTNPADLTTGGYGGTGSGNPVQTDVDPTVTGLEYPVQVAASDYYDNVLAPAAFPEAGTIRLTSVLGYNEVSFGAAVSVPLSEVGLFTESVPFQNNPPLDETIQVSPPVPPKPPLGVRYMVAYNTFNTLSKTSAFVLQVDWELRFA